MLLSERDFEDFQASECPRVNCASPNDRAPVPSLALIEVPTQRENGGERRMRAFQRTGRLSSPERPARPGVPVHVDKALRLSITWQIIRQGAVRAPKIITEDRVFWWWAAEERSPIGPWLNARNGFSCNDRVLRPPSRRGLLASIVSSSGYN